MSLNTDLKIKEKDKDSVKFYNIYILFTKANDLMTVTLQMGCPADVDAGCGICVEGQVDFLSVDSTCHKRSGQRDGGKGVSRASLRSRDSRNPGMIGCCPMLLGNGLRFLGNGPKPLGDGLRALGDGQRVLAYGAGWRWADGLLEGLSDEVGRGRGAIHGEGCLQVPSFTGLGADCGQSGYSS